MSDGESSRVVLYVYDVTRGMARQMSPGLLGRQIEGIWHTAVVAFDGEYFFGSDGINCAPPGSITMLGSPTEIVELGDTAIPRDMFHDFLHQVGSDRFRGDRYHLTDHNCNNFSDEVAHFLTGNKIPAHIVALPHEILSTPFGSMMKPMLDQMMSQFGPSGGEMPHFGTPPPAAATPPSTSETKPPLHDHDLD